MENVISESTVAPPVADTAVLVKKVTFKSGQNTLYGNLFLPEDFAADRSYGAVLVGGSLTSVKEQMSGTYARKMAKAGLLALAFDYSGYGESEGEPRQYEDPAQKLQDVEAAVTYLSSLPYVKSVEALGICTTGGNVAYLAADDNRVKVVATIAAWLPQPSVTPMLYRGEAQVEKLRQQGREARRHYQQTGENQLIPAYNNTDKTASYLGPMEYYMDQARGGGVKEWKNVFSVMSWEKWLDFDPMSEAALITTPYLVIHSDGCALPNMARAFFDALRGEKELVWGDGYHFDYYDQPKQVTFAAGKAATFLRGHLNG